LEQNKNPKLMNPVLLTCCCCPSCFFRALDHIAVKLLFVLDFVGSRELVITINGSLKPGYSSKTGKK